MGDMFSSNASVSDELTDQKKALDFHQTVLCSGGPRRRFPFQLAILIFFSLILPITGFYLLHDLIEMIHFVHEPVHTAIEITGVMIALFVAMIFVINKQVEDYNKRVWIASALLAICIFDIYHASIHPGNAFVWLHTLSVVIGGLLLMILFVLPMVANKLGLKNWLPYAVSSISIAIGLVVILYSEALPGVTDENEFTLTIKLANIFGGIFFMIAGIGCAIEYRKSMKRSILDYLFFAGFCFIFGVSGITFYYSSIWSVEWWLWHFFRIIAYLLILGYIIIELIRGKDELLWARDDLNTHRKKLEDINASLKKEIEEGTRREQVILRQTGEILELSTPVMEVWKGIIIAPVIGTFDSKRTEQFMDTLLNAISQKNARIALVDITGVPVIDTQTGEYLIRAFTAAKLLGTEVILTGVRPAIAQTLVHLGIDLSLFKTKSSLSAGLTESLDILKREGPVINNNYGRMS